MCGSHRDGCVIVVLFTLLLSLAAVVVSIVTDAWFKVEASVDTPQAFQKNWTYEFGLWRRCYNNIPDTISVANRLGSNLNCVGLEDALLPMEPEKLNANDKLNLILSWTVILGACLCAVFQLSTILTLLCGVWRGCGKDMNHCCLFFSSALLTLLASMLGITSGIAFLAQRSLDGSIRGLYPAMVGHRYYWSFGLLWAGAALTFLDGFVLLCLVWKSYDISATSKYSSFDM